MELEKLYTPQEIAKIYKVSDYAVLVWIRNKTLPAVKISQKLYRVKESDLKAFMKSTVE